MDILFLGTGTSHGVPSLDCMIDRFARCPKGVCRASQADPRHARTRSSLYIMADNISVLIDVSADFRQQALREEIRAIDAVLITHGHSDHIGGVPDTRSYTKEPGKPLTFYGSQESISTIRSSFAYIFDPDTFVGGGIPHIRTETVQSEFSVGSLQIRPVQVIHGTLNGCFGYRIGSVAYIPDVKTIPEKSEKLLYNLDLLIIDCLRDTREHSTHIIMPEAVAIARKLSPKRCLFTHMSHDIHFEIDKKKLDPWMDFAYDGMRIVV